MRRASSGIHLGHVFADGRAGVAWLAAGWSAGRQPEAPAYFASGFGRANVAASVPDILLMTSGRPGAAFPQPCPDNCGIKSLLGAPGGVVGSVPGGASGAMISSMSRALIPLSPLNSS